MQHGIAYSDWCNKDNWKYSWKWRSDTKVCYTVQSSSVAQSCLTLCDPMDCSMPGLPVHHQLPELAQTHDPSIRDFSNASALCIRIDSNRSMSRAATQNASTSCVRQILHVPSWLTIQLLRVKFLCVDDKDEDGGGERSRSWKNTYHVTGNHWSMTSDPHHISVGWAWPSLFPHV